METRRAKEWLRSTKRECHWRWQGQEWDRGRGFIDVFAVNVFVAHFKCALVSVCIHANGPLGIQGDQKARYGKKARWFIGLAPNHCHCHAMEGADCANCSNNDPHLWQQWGWHQASMIMMRLWMIRALDLYPGVLLQCEAGWEEDWKGISTRQET